MKKELGGYVTLYLALTLGVMLSMMAVLIDGVRRQTVRLETEGVTDLALFSVFGEYNRQLLEQYDLFFIDTTYGEGSPSLERVEEHLQFYMNENFQKKGSETGFLQDLTALRCDNTTLTAWEVASDRSGAAIRKQILDYQLGKAGIGWIQSAAENLNLIYTQGLDGRDVEGEWDQVQGNIKEGLERKRREWEEAGDSYDYSLDNPADYVSQTRHSGILYKALPEGAAVSTIGVDLSKYFSRRRPLTGYGFWEEDSTRILNIAEKGILWSYLEEKCGSYLKPLEKGLLTYQQEYLLAGEAKDDENLQEVLEEILQLRLAANLAFLMTNSNLQSQAEAAAVAICTATMLPELIQPVKLSILYAWCYAESVQDIRILLDGNRVGLQKTETNWNTPLSQLAFYQSHLGEYRKSDQGMDYSDYLAVLFLMRQEETVMERFMDLCEMDIRRTPGNEYFSIDGCLSAVEVRTNVSSGYGYSYEIIRSYSY